MDEIRLRFRSRKSRDQPSWKIQVFSPDSQRARSAKTCRCQTEGVRLEFVDIHVAHHAIGRVEVLVVIDPRGTRTEDPFAIRPQVCLGGPAFDLRANRILRSCSRRG